VPGASREVENLRNRPAAEPPEIVVDSHPRRARRRDLEVEPDQPLFSATTQIFPEIGIARTSAC